MLRIPSNYDNNHPYPLVFAFHWNGGTMGDIDGGGSSGSTWSDDGLREQADNSTNSKMIFVAPQGNGNGWPRPDPAPWRRIRGVRAGLDLPGPGR